MPRSSFGRQYKSKLPSNNSGTIVRHGRETREKVFISYEHSAIGAFGVESPGPAKILLPASVGKQIETRYPGAPSACFTQAKARGPASESRVGDPGPQKYKLPAVVFQTTAISRVRSEPKIHFGKMERDQLVKVTQPQLGGDSPGPGYGMPTTLKLAKMSHASRNFPNKTSRGDSSPGPMYRLRGVGPGESSQENLPAQYRRAMTPKLGTSTREQRAKMFTGREMNAEMEKALIGAESPGPQANYQLSAVTFGKQVSSKFATRPKSAFGRAGRWASYDKMMEFNRTPGPGSYEY